MKSYPLAIYTAQHGLAWTYPKDDIAYGELDYCRTAFGHLPDFSGGDAGFEGVLITPKRVFCVRCQCAPKYDYLGRDALYLSATWVSREDAGYTDFESLIHAPALTDILVEIPPFFMTFAACGHVDRLPNSPDGLPDFRKAGTLASQLAPNTIAILKRPIGETREVSCRYIFPVDHAS